MTYADLLTSRVLNPLGMTATVVERTPPDLAAWGYRDGQRADVAQFAAFPGTGDVWSTVGDLTRWIRVFHGTIVGHLARFHPGDNPGYQSFLGYMPDLRTTVAILCNNEESNLDDLLRTIAPKLPDVDAH